MSPEAATSTVCGSQVMVAGPPATKKIPQSTTMEDPPVDDDGVASFGEPSTQKGSVLGNKGGKELAVAQLDGLGECPVGGLDGGALLLEIGCLSPGWCRGQQEREQKHRKHAPRRWEQPETLDRHRILRHRHLLLVEPTEYTVS
jgi:hypothetical protein